MDPGFSQAYSERGLTLLQQRKFAAAIADLETAKRIDNTPRRLALLAYGYGLAGITAIAGAPAPAEPAAPVTEALCKLRSGAVGVRDCNRLRSLIALYPRSHQLERRKVTRREGDGRARVLVAVV